MKDIFVQFARVYILASDLRQSIMDSSSEKEELQLRYAACLFHLGELAQEVRKKLKPPPKV
jgi:hypothetical protein